jgi:hypothetical protein
MLQGELQSSGLYRTNEIGWIGRLEVTRRSPNLLVVIAGIYVGCGNDDAVYVYDYPASASRRLTVQSLGEPTYGEWVWDIHWSERLASGTQSLLVVRRSVQCASNMFQLGFYAYHTQGQNTIWSPAFTDYHSVYGENLDVKITPKELILQFSVICIDTGIFLRPRVVHVLLSRPGAQRRRHDPVALHPRDFVDEWLSRPWTEMTSRSESPPLLQKWHRLLFTNGVQFGEFKLLQECSARPGVWQIGLTLERQAKATHYFLVRDLGEYRYRMVDTSTTRQAGCPGEGTPHETTTPTLFPARSR